MFEETKNTQKPEVKQERKVRPERKFTLSDRNTIALPTGGFFPEDAKIGRRYKTEIRPVDNSDVINYRYSGGICPPPEEYLVI